MCAAMAGVSTHMLQFNNGNKVPVLGLGTWKASSVPFTFRRARLGSFTKFHSEFVSFSCSCAALHQFTD